MIKRFTYSFLIILVCTSVFNHYVYSQLLHYQSAYDTLERQFYFNSIHSELAKPYTLQDVKMIKNYSNLELPVPNGFVIANKDTANKRYFSALPVIDALPGKEFGTNGFEGEYPLGAELQFLRDKSSLDSGRNNLFACDFKYSYNQAIFPDYIQSYVYKTHVVPGQGHADSVKGIIYYQNISFYAAKSVGKYFDFEGGFGKHFFGDGYRSLFLSDASYSYPYFQITTTIWKIKYINLYTNFKDSTSGNWFKAENKYGAFHFLSWDATKRLNFNFFEAIIWAGRSYDVNYLNPVIFYRPVEFSLGDATNPNPDNALMGFGTHYTIGKSQVLYGQLLLNDFDLSNVKAGFSHMLHPHDTTIQWGSWTNKQAFQLGYKYFNVAGIKNLNFQTEYNYVRPYVYSHRDVIANYGNFNEPLADPLGANFWESVTFLKYIHKQWYFEIEYMHYLTGLDSNGSHFGQDIYRSTFDAYLPDEHNVVVKEYGNKVGQGITTTVNYISPKVSYLIYPRMNLRIELGYIYRTQKSVIETKNTNYIFFGIKTSLNNRHYDL